MTEENPGFLFGLAKPLKIPGFSLIMRNVTNLIPTDRGLPAGEMR